MRSAAYRVPSGLVYGDPALLRLLLPVSLACCSSFVFPARGAGQSHGEEPAPCLAAGL